MPDVFFYRNDQPGAPVLDDASNSLNALLHACLVTGFGSIGLVSITRSGSVATGSTASAHAFQVGDPVLIAGADQPEYNGTFTVTAVAGNTLSWAVSGTPTTPATGTFTVKIAPVGWERPYVSGNVSVFRSADIASSRRFFRINDGMATHASGYKQAELRLYEDMTAVSTGTLRATVACLKTYPTYTAKWLLVASARTVYLLHSRDGSNVLYPNVYFGDINSYKAGDTYQAFIGFEGPWANGDMLISVPTGAATAGEKLCRAYTGTGGAVDMGALSPAMYTYGVPGGVSPVDGSLPIAWPRFAIEQHPTYGRVLRGEVPGVGTGMSPYGSHITTLAAKPSGWWERLTGVIVKGTTRDVLLIGITSGNYGVTAIDLTGPWH